MFAAEFSFCRFFYYWTTKKGRGIIMKKVLVTGASKGIGRAIAVAFAAKGYDVAIHYLSDLEGAEKTRQRCKNAGRGQIIVLQGDISKERDVMYMFDRINTEMGGLDILVNNAGISSFGLIQDISEEEWDRLFAVNVKGMFLCSRAAVKLMLKNKAGAIVNIGSMWGETGASCETAYSASKAAVSGFTRALAKELAPSGIRVNCVAPGLIETAMNRRFSEDDLQAFAGETPLGRIGKPEEVAQAAVFLAGEEASFITGQVLSVDGGVTI